MYFGVYIVSITDLMTDHISTEERRAYYPGFCTVRDKYYTCTLFINFYNYCFDQFKNWGLWISFDFIISTQLMRNFRLHRIFHNQLLKDRVSIYIV